MFVINFANSKESDFLHDVTLDRQSYTMSTLAKTNDCRFSPSYIPVISVTIYASKFAISVGSIQHADSADSCIPDYISQLLPKWHTLQAFSITGGWSKL